MHTISVIAGGLALLGAIMAGTRWTSAGGASPRALAARIFLPAWFAATLINLWVGMTRAGYTVAEEIPIQFVVFLVPGAGAVLLARREVKPVRTAPRHPG